MRKTVTLPDPIEDAVREYQMIQMRSRKRDVPFTESLVSLVALGLATFELMANKETAIPETIKDLILNHWVDVDRSQEARWNGLQDLAHEAAEEWDARFSALSTQD